MNDRRFRAECCVKPTTCLRFVHTFLQNVKCMFGARLFRESLSTDRVAGLPDRDRTGCLRPRTQSKSCLT